MRNTEAKQRVPSPAMVQRVIEGFGRLLESKKGSLGRERLAASGQQIQFGQSGSALGYYSIYFLDATGLHESEMSEAGDTWVGGSNGPLITIPLTVEELVQKVAVCPHPSVPFSQLLRWLRSQLNSIPAHAAA